MNDFSNLNRICEKPDSGPKYVLSSIRSCIHVAQYGDDVIYQELNFD